MPVPTAGRHALKGQILARKHRRASRCGRHQPCQQLAAAFMGPQRAELPLLFHIHAGAGASGPPPASYGRQLNPTAAAGPCAAPP